MAQTPEKITTHVVDGIARFLQQFKSKPQTQSYFTVYLTRAQEIEDAFYQLLTERNITTGVGNVLDILGAIVGIARQGFTDDQYRVMIRVQILANISSGTFEDILAVFTQLDPDNTYTIEDSYPAAFTLTASEIFNTPIPETRIAELLRRIKSAGVGAQLVFPISEPDEFLFQFSDSSSLLEDSTSGFLSDGDMVELTRATMPVLQNADYLTAVVPNNPSVLREKCGAGNGTGTWVFAAINSSGDPTGVLVSVNDGESFSFVSMPGGSTLTELHLVEFTAGRFFVGGNLPTSNTAVWSSLDGLTWTITDLSGSDEWHSVAGSGAEWVAINDAGDIYRSTNATAFTLITTEAVQRVIWNDPLSMFVAFDVDLQTSADGTVWNNEFTDLDRVYYVAVDDVGYMVAALGDGDIRTSPDGSTWTNQANVPNASGVDSLVFFDGQFLHYATNVANELYSSLDGVTWTLVMTSSTSFAGLMFPMHDPNAYLATTVLSPIVTQVKRSEGSFEASQTNAFDAAALYPITQLDTNAYVIGAASDGEKMLLLIFSPDDATSYVASYELTGGKFTSVIEV